MKRSVETFEDAIAWLITENQQWVEANGDYDNDADPKEIGLVVFSVIFSLINYGFITQDLFREYQTQKTFKWELRTFKQLYTLDGAIAEQFALSEQEMEYVISRVDKLLRSILWLLDCHRIPDHPYSSVNPMILFEALKSMVEIGLEDSQK